MEFDRQGPCHGIYLLGLNLLFIFMNQIIPTEIDLIDLARQGLLLVVLVSAPVAAVAAIVSIVMGFFQTSTGLADQTISQVPRLMAVYAVIGLVGAWALSELINFGSLLLGMLSNVQ